MKISFSVNEISYIPELTDPEMTLLFFLRNILALTAAKNGCGEGHCGSCTVLIDGRVKRSCLIKMRDLDGKHVITPEALSNEERIHCIIYAFILEGAVQCGFCTPGFVMTAKALCWIGILILLSRRSKKPSQETFAAAPVMSRSSMRSEEVLLSCGQERYG